MGLFDLLAGPVKGLIGSIGTVIDDLHTSGEEKAAAKLKLAELEAATLIQLTEAGKALVDAQRDVIVAEAKGESWIQRSWRPVAMLTLLGLIVWTVRSTCPSGYFASIMVGSHLPYLVMWQIR